MKKILFAFTLMASLQMAAQKHRLEKLWETDTTIAIPESVLPDFKNNMLYVSLIDGAPWGIDGKGGIGKLSTNGNRYDSTWITGLNAPKGMGVVGNKLYVADMGEVVVIDIKKGTIEKKVAVEGATGLNDIAVTDKGTVFVSDSRTGRIWKLEKEKPELYLDTIKGINGLKVIGDDLYIGAGKNFMKADRNKILTKIAEVPEGIDGIEPVGNGDFILTSWGGYIFYVTAAGAVETILDTHLEKKNTADIGYDAKKRIVYVPTFNAKTVVAYQLK